MAGEGRSLEGSVLGHGERLDLILKVLRSHLKAPGLSLIQQTPMESSFQMQRYSLKNP